MSAMMKTFQALQRTFTRNTKRTFSSLPMPQTTIRNEVQLRNQEEQVFNLEQYLAERESTKALEIFQSLPEPPSHSLTQRLAILLSKKGSRNNAKEAFGVMKSVYT